MRLNLIPALKDNVPSTMKLLQQYSWSSIAVIYNSLSENSEAKTLVQRHVEGSRNFAAGWTKSITFIKILSGLSTAERTRQAAKVLAKIKLSGINMLVVYASAEEVDLLISIGKMMELTGPNYTWILPWKAQASTTILPFHTMTLRPINMTVTEDLLSDGFDVITRAFQSCHENKTNWNVSFPCCFDTGDQSLGKEFYRYVKAT